MATTYHKQMFERWVKENEIVQGVTEVQPVRPIRYENELGCGLGPEATVYAKDEFPLEPTRIEFIDYDNAYVTLEGPCGTWPFFCLAVVTEPEVVFEAINGREFCVTKEFLELDCGEEVEHSDVEQFIRGYREACDKLGV